MIRIWAIDSRPSRSRSLAVVLASLALLTSIALGQDPTKTEPEYYKVEYEDARVRVVRAKLPPGAKSPMHAHGERFLVVVSGAQLRTTSADGKVTESTLATGTFQHQMPQRHATENIGTTTLEVVYTEIQGTMPAEPSATAAAQHSQQQVTVQPTPSAPPQADLSKRQSVPEPGYPNPAPTQKPEEKKPAQAAASPASQQSAEQITTGQPSPIIGANPWKTLAVLGQQLAFVEQGQGTPVILVHGTLGDYRTWAPQVTEFSKWYHVVSYSRRYHYPNLATGREGDYTYERHQKDLTEFLRNLNVGPVHLVGQGYGAVVAAMVAAEHPEMVRSLVLIEPIMDDFLNERMQTSARYEREEIFGIIRKPMRKGDFTRGVQQYVDWAREGPAWDQLRPDLQLQKRENGNSLTAQLEHASAPQFGCDDAKRIKAPTLIVSGNNPSPFSKASIDGLKSCVAGSTSAAVPNSGKAPNLDNPQEFNRLMMEWWAKEK
jgi:non-heme chloroperoxidase